MELYQEILCHVFANEKIQVSFPNLINTDVTKIVELECYKALAKIKAILDDDALADSECFQQIEEIVCAFEALGSNGGSRHDFG
ncbi:hypothetical protein H9X86_04525 [Pseudoflavonifractor capillosus]|uniref:hypothetical protein n=1 Tax=Pseudoflavonifractor capillosus TaxID=106588 RepID=UPI00195C1FA5|nr:hypothetical protein [Pseudoflavonifractor capillosus]MBM6896638.1 hypothetical protein [Pseudoflavonifractor capillosus]